MASPEQCVELVKSESQRIQQYLGVLSAEDLARPSALEQLCPWRPTPPGGDVKLWLNLQSPTWRSFCRNRQSYCAVLFRQRPRN